MSVFIAALATVFLAPPRVQRGAGAEAAGAARRAAPFSRPARFFVIAPGAGPPQRGRHRSQLPPQQRVQRGAVCLAQRRQRTRLQAPHHLL